jgi:hypothetical protein
MVAKCETEPMDETLIILGNGEKTTSNRKACIGDLEAIVCNDDQLTDGLIAIHPIVDAGYNVSFSSWGGSMDKPSIEHTIPILRDGKKWLVDIEELKKIKIKTKPTCYKSSITIA